MLGQRDHVEERVRADLRLANAGGAHGIPILFHAVIGGHVELARFLVEHGATTSPDTLGQCLHAAVHSGSVELVTWLLRLGADVNAKDWQDKAPLQRAREAERQEIAAVLRDYGARN